jgi:hypothetical protein
MKNAEIKAWLSANAKHHMNSMTCVVNVGSLVEAAVLALGPSANPRTIATLATGVAVSMEIECMLARANPKPRG